MWLLALAVPVQGFAAASMVGCGTGHGAAGLHFHAQGMHGHQKAASHSFDGHADAMAHAGHPHPADAASHGDAHESYTDTAKESKFSKASCSACASCCTSAALPTTPVVFQATEVPSVFILLAPQPVVSFVSGGLERPPRSFLA